MNEKILCDRCGKEFENDLYTDIQLENKLFEKICQDCREDAVLDFLE
jgi:NMD protein affecting ribosome stability and mRNA decay